ncbi:MAG TPA: ABC transporter ATP-binding protein [Pyrinomonadaceae bacterium]|jgi:ATP-binding cassette subfamily B protein
MSPNKSKIDPSQISWRERLAALKYVLPFFQLIWETYRGYLLLMILLRLLRAFVPVAALWTGKLIIDSVVAANSVSDIARNPFSYSHLWRLVALELGIVITGELLSRASSLIESLTGDLFSNRLSIRLMRHAATLDLYQFENPEFYDRLERARRQTTGRIGLLPQIFQIAQDAFTIASLAAALLVFNPWVLLLLVLAVIPSFLGATHYAALEYSLLYRWTPERRLLDYFRFLGASDRTAKEVQMFGLSDWLTRRYDALATKFYEDNRMLSIRRSISSFGLSLIGTLGYYGAYVSILIQALSGTITIGTLTFLAASFSRSRDLIESLLNNASSILSQSLYLKDLFDFFDTEPTIFSPPNARKVPMEIKEGFTFENVGFRYPESEKWAIRNVNFKLSPGERIALVGENGAGKTTLTKLIARLYDPTEGRILLDGIDLRDYDLNSLRGAISVIFQDFVRYDLAFETNIGVGEIKEVDRYLTERQIQNGHDEISNDDSKNSEVPSQIISAAEKSLASELLPRLPKGYNQMLGRRFDGGVDLSGGEWQKVALGRAYMREAKLLILDEPTAALDARAEYTVFERFSELVRGRMAILISHRFSTVRMADRIIVLQNGNVVEDGTHDNLIEKDGIYAELFRLQAKGYR